VFREGRAVWKEGNCKVRASKRRRSEEWVDKTQKASQTNIAET